MFCKIGKYKKVKKETKESLISKFQIIFYSFSFTFKLSWTKYIDRLEDVQRRATKIEPLQGMNNEARRRILN